jgi:hypothetical protein
MTELGQLGFTRHILTMGRVAQTLPPVMLHELRQAIAGSGQCRCRGDASFYLRGFFMRPKPSSNTSSMCSLNNRAMRKASGKDGSNLPVSNALID